MGESKLDRWERYQYPQPIAQEIIITRDKIYPKPARPGFAWVWSYTVSSPNEYDASGTADEVRAIAKRRSSKTGFPIIDKTKGQTALPKAEKRRTLTADRFSIGCSYCGYLTAERTLASALETARRLQLRHATAGENVEVFDLMAQKGVCQQWDTKGNCIGLKPWK